MSYSKHRLKEVVALQKAVLDQIEADLGEFGSAPRRQYIDQFTSEFQKYEATCDFEEVLDAASAVHVVWIGDYHALSRSRTFAIEFLSQLKARKSNVALGVEMVFGRNQKTLDRWIAGEIAEGEFLEQIRYVEEWGCDWPSYKMLFEAAQDLEIPILGVDCHPRRDMRSIRRRDEGVARRIAQLVEDDPQRTIVVLFGESHLASSHLPQRVSRALGKAGVSFQDVLVLQNIESLYWSLQETGKEGVQAVRIRPTRYCVFNATPVEKYESFRQYLMHCTEGEDGVGDWTRFVHTVIDVLFDFLKMEKDPAILDYVPNSVFIDDFRLDYTTEETARFIHQWCRGEMQASTVRDSSDVFFMAILEHALGYFFSKLLDSSRDGIESLGQRVLQNIGYNEELVRTVNCLLDPAKRPSLQHFERLRATVEKNPRRSRMHQMLSQVLGYALGRRLHKAYLESRISRKEIQVLLHDPLEKPRRPLECYAELSTRLA